MIAADLPTNSEPTEILPLVNMVVLEDTHKEGYLAWVQRVHVEGEALTELRVAN